MNFFWPIPEFLCIFKYELFVEPGNYPPFPNSLRFRFDKDELTIYLLHSGIIGRNIFPSQNTGTNALGQVERVDYAKKFCFMFALKTGRKPFYRHLYIMQMPFIHLFGQTM